MDATSPSPGIARDGGMDAAVSAGSGGRSGAGGQAPSAGAGAAGRQSNPNPEPGRAEDLGDLVGLDSPDEPILEVGTQHAAPTFAEVALLDSEGDLVIWTGTAIEKYDSAFELEWSFDASDRNVSNGSFSASDDRGVFFGTNEAGNKYGVGKVDADGARVFLTTWDGGGVLTATAAGPDGGVVVSGYISCATGSVCQWIALHDREGQRRWVQQYGPDHVAVPRLFVDRDGLIHSVRGNAARKVDPQDGTQLWVGSIETMPSGGPLLGKLNEQRHLAQGPARDAFIVTTQLEASPNTFVAEFSLDWRLNWWREGERKRIVLPSDESMFWVGNLSTGVPALGDGSIFLAGLYSTGFASADLIDAAVFAPTGGMNMGFVGRYDAKGERVWFRRIADSSIQYLLVGPSGYPLVIATIGDDSYWFKLDGDDGSLIE